MGSPKNQGDRTDLQSIKRALESNSSIKTLLDSDLELIRTAFVLPKGYYVIRTHPEITNRRLYGSGERPYRQDKNRREPFTRRLF